MREWGYIWYELELFFVSKTWRDSSLERCISDSASLNASINYSYRLDGQILSVKLFKEFIRACLQGISF
jgi:hypothetical protein